MNRIILFLPLIGLILSLGSLEADSTNTTSVPAAPDNALTSVLEVACEQANLNQVQALLDQGAPINGKAGSYSAAPLHFAVKHDIKVLKFLIARGAQVDITDRNGSTPLSYACYYNNNEAAQALLDAGANPNVARTDGITPLIYAVRNGNDILASLLISHNADVNVHDPSDPALFYAVSKDRLSTVKLLLDAGANPNLFSMKQIDLHKPRFAILSWAARTNDLPLIDLLLAHGADLNGKSEDGTTPLMRAATSATPTTFEYLLGKGADVNLQDNLGETALMYSILYDHIPTWQQMIQRGAKLELQDNKGLTVLMHACRNDYAPAVRFLVDQGADVHSKDLMGNSALTYLANHGDLDTEQLLQAKGADSGDIHILIRPNPVPPLPQAKSWALAVGAIYAQTDGINPQVLGYEDPRPLDEVKRRMKDDWDIVDRPTFLKEMEDLATVGHRTFYQKAGAKLAAMKDDQFNAFLIVNAIVQAPDGWGEAATPNAVRQSYLTWGGRTGVAWDLCRYANMINQGYDAGYISEEEAWNLLIANARQVQSNFSSWQEMSNNFLDSRQVWAGVRDYKFDACAVMLLNPKDPNSPWNQLPWKTDLSQN